MRLSIVARHSRKRKLTRRQRVNDVSECKQGPIDGGTLLETLTAVLKNRSYYCRFSFSCRKAQKSYNASKCESPLVTVHLSSVNIRTLGKKKREAEEMNS